MPDACLSVVVRFLFLYLSQVLFLRNFGVIVGGETVEETFHIANNLMIAIETQVFTSLCVSSQINLLVCHLCSASVPQNQVTIE